MQVIERKMSRTELAEMAQSGFGDMVKGVVDVSCGRGVYDPAIQEKIRKIIGRWFE